eukprot:m.20307 g.20307  ORF g.20307 m.20307 type:complete len:93 (-) comp12103_c0_seq1:56-334(-)
MRRQETINNTHFCTRVRSKRAPQEKVSGVPALYRYTTQRIALIAVRALLLVTANRQQQSLKLTKTIATTDHSKHNGLNARFSLRTIRLHEAL